MTPEEQRELWLKRFLPALAIFVIYFVFISGFVTENTEKAQKKYETLARRGISESAIPSMESQLSHLQKEVGRLQEKDDKLHKELINKDIYISRLGSTNATIAQVSFLLANNNLKIDSENVRFNFEENELPLAFRQSSRWIKNLLNDQDATMEILEINFTGDYLNTLQFMKGLSHEKYKVLPISLSMEQLPSGSLKWTLLLWM